MEYKRVLATFAGGKEYEKDRNDFSSRQKKEMKEEGV
jgi:hypothetical protein